MLIPTHNLTGQDTTPFLQAIPSLHHFLPRQCLRCPQRMCEREPLQTSTNPLTLIDCTNLDQRALLRYTATHRIESDSLNALALYNVQDQINAEPQLILNGVRGMFYQGETLCAQLRGLEAILSGAFWLSRKQIAEDLNHSPETSDVLGPTRHCLFSSY